MRKEKRNAQKILTRVIAWVLSMVFLFTANVIPVNAASAPVITSAVAKSSTSVKLKWKKMSGVSGYVVYQKKEDGKYKLIKTINGAKSTGCTVNDLNSGTKYSYKIKAFAKKSGTKYTSFSKVKSVYTKLATPKITYIEGKTANSIMIKWKKVSKADGYIVYKKTRDGYEKLATIKSGKTNKYTVKNLKAEKKYGFTVKAFKKTGNKTLYSSYAEVKYSFPTMPVGLNERHLIDSNFYEYRSGAFTDAFGNTYMGVHYFDSLYQSSNGREPHATYNLNYEFNHFKGSIVATQKTSTIKSYYINIFADGVLVYSVDGYTKTTGKINFDIDVSNTEQLSICMGHENMGGDFNEDICIVNAKLYK